MLLLSLVAIVSSRVLVHAMTLDLEAMGLDCRALVGCASMNYLSRKNFFHRNCECDSRCEVYGDCCTDAPSTGGKYDTDTHDCMAFGIKPYQGAYVVGSCPRDRGGPCEGNDLSDPLMSAPVTVPGGATFRNAHCALCHGVDPNSLVSWSPLVSCASLAPYNLSAGFVWGALRRSPPDEWGVDFRGQFHGCDVLFDKPPTLRSEVRLCRAGVVSTCPEGYRREAVRKKCGAYTAVVYTLEGAAYRNAHCAICNGVGLDMLVCDPRSVISPKYKNYSLAHIFYWNREELRGRPNRGGPGTCPEGQRYDPYAKKCRRVVCGFPGYEKVGDKCEKG